MDIVNLIISLVSGVVGGNAIGAAMPNQSLGSVGNSITGLLGGAAGSFILSALGLFGAHVAGAPDAAAPALNITSLLGNIIGSGVCGAVLTVIVGFFKNACVK